MQVPKFLKSVRYLLAAINGLFLLTGITLLIVGVVVLVAFNQYDTLMTNRFFTLSGFIIATAVIIFVVSLLGFYGAFSEQFYFIAGYVVLLLVILIFEITITVLGFGLQNDAANEIRSPMSQSLQLYESRRENAVVWDDLQMGFKCCGIAGRHDWNNNRIPISCCHIDYGTISPFECTAANAYTVGCANVLGEWLGYNAYAVGATGAFVTSLQVLITAGAAWLAYRSRFEEVELES
ncbi:leukocyte surface antigen CD53-like [Vanessa atalanta]|uniref:leukocyte surface antigen CD53-like n=1 Tax=Vanessa atalanta TaxID=42275 RepID=UPI001FCDA376|nr:leukocyte surface antigen CD53-like [Vanessa atalanta]